MEGVDPYAKHRPDTSVNLYFHKSLQWFFEVYTPPGYLGNQPTVKVVSKFQPG